MAPEPGSGLTAPEPSPHGLQVEKGSKGPCCREAAEARRDVGVQADPVQYDDEFVEKVRATLGWVSGGPGSQFVSLKVKWVDL
jgi:hypothetical protein